MDGCIFFYFLLLAIGVINVFILSKGIFMFNFCFGNSLICRLESDTFLSYCFPQAM